MVLSTLLKLLFLKLVMALRLILAAGGRAARVQLARDGVGHVGQLLLLLLKVLCGGGGSCKWSNVSINVL
jgi:hypothetical protein